MISKFKKIVIKIGSSSIIDEKKGKVKIKWLNSLCKDITLLANENKNIAIVSSGAIALGKKTISNHKVISRLEDKQAAAAIGQIELANCWQQELKKNNINQVDIVGLATDYCVKYSSIDAYNEGFKTNVLRFCVRGISVETTETAFKEMKDIGIFII